MHREVLVNMKGTDKSVEETDQSLMLGQFARQLHRSDVVRMPKVYDMPEKLTINEVTNVLKGNP
jgi:hypothetical protein